MAGSDHTDERSNVSEATALQQDHVFQSIDADLRDFIVKFSEGHRNLAGLICDQTAVLKRHIVAHNLDTRNTISKTIIERQTRAVSETLRRNFLQSLRFGEMNQRKIEIKSSHPETYNWLFGKLSSEDEIARSDSGIAVHPRLDGTDLIKDFDNQPWDNFGDWLKSDKTCYWISGKPGSGKSPLMRLLLHHPSTYSILRESNPKATAVNLVSYFFLVSGDPTSTHCQGSPFYSTPPNTK